MITDKQIARLQKVTSLEELEVAIKDFLDEKYAAEIIKRDAVAVEVNFDRGGAKESKETIVGKRLSKSLALIKRKNMNRYTLIHIGTGLACSPSFRKSDLRKIMAFLNSQEGWSEADARIASATDQAGIRNDEIAMNAIKKTYSFVNRTIV